MVNPTDTSSPMTNPLSSESGKDAAALPPGDLTGVVDAADAGGGDRMSRLEAEKRNSGVRVSRMGIGLAVAVLIAATIFTFASISARSTQLEKTKQVFGEDAITALQLADQLRILPGAGQSFDAVNLTGTPGLGHLRRALLHETHYQWDTLESGSVDSVGGEDALRFTLQFEDPRGKRVPIVEIPLELTEGWVGTPDGEQRVKVIPRVQTALEFQLKMMKNVTQKTYDDR